MQHLSFLYSEKKNYKKAKDEAKKSIYKSKLIQVFVGHTNVKKIQKLLLKLQKDFPNTTLIGTTTAGEISHAKMYDKSTTISLSLFKKTKLKAHVIQEMNKASGQILSKKICSKNTKAAIILSEGLKGLEYEEFLRGIKKENPHLIIAGGLAGDNFSLEKTYVFLGTKIYTQGAIGVSFSGKKLFADNRYNLNWTPIGKEFTITSAQGNLVKQIDGENAVKIFKKYLGEKIFENNASSLPDFQMLYKEGDTLVSRTPMAVDGESLIFAGPLKENQKVQFGFSNAASVISGSNLIGNIIDKNPAQAIYIYSCIARKTLLGKVLENEFKAFESIAPTSGFFTYGEFYSTSGDNALLNCTTTILILSESQKRNKITSQKVNTSSLENVTFNALTHFIEQTAHELKENITLLEEYKNVVDKSSLISKTDINGNITYVNETFCKTSGYSQQELLGQNHNIVKDSAMSNFIFKKMWSTILKGKVWKGILSNKAKNGSIYYVDATIMPILDENKKVSEFIAIRQNITKQIEANQRLKEKEQLIKAIFDNQDSIVLLSSKEKGLLNANKKLFEYLDFKNFREFKSKHDCICNFFIEEEGYMYPSKYPNWIDDTAHAKVDKKAKILTKDGVMRTFNIKVKQIDDTYVINLYDITILEKALMKAHSSEQAKSTFLANMSHEIRTPLNGILGFTDILNKKELDKDSKRYVDIIHKSGETLLNVVNDILDFSKLESGELSLYEKEADLFHEMEAAVATFASVAKGKSIDYCVYIDPNIPKNLYCDIQRVKQVLNNLISNAIKFTHDNGNVTVTISLQKIKNKKATLQFSVKDSGIGIKEENITSIFQAFSQADNSTSREFGGTGLGLSISNQYIKMMHSNIQVKSQENQGSEFYFILDFTILDNEKSINGDSLDMNIVILKAQTKLDCAINETVHAYLKAWNYTYKEIDDLNQLQATDSILIVCSKLFDNSVCMNALEKFQNLQLFYIEGSEKSFECQHERFHFLEQPMTGSLLFDKIITLSSHAPDKLENTTNIHTKTSTFKGHILVAEDNQTNQMLIEILLKERNLNFTIVSNGKEAVDEALRKHYDIIFMDINMPVMDGLEATKLLRKKGYIKPIVSLSANVIESDIKSFLVAGVNDTLNKPIVPQELDKCLSNYLQAKKEIQRDTIDIDMLCKILNISDKNIITKLLQSFKTSILEITKQLTKENLTNNSLHNLKGLVGNLRFKNLYALTTEYENSISTWNEILHKKNKEFLLGEIEALLEQINE